MKKQEGTVMEKEKDVWSFKKSDLVTIPNIITYVRFVLIIPFVYFFLAEQYIYAAICIGLSGLSDCFDGMAARKLNQVTPLGKILDPIADKVTLFAVVICMVIYVPMVLPILVTLLVKDLIMLLGGADLIKKRLTPPSANWYGKVGTIIFYFSVCLIVFLKAFFAYENMVLDLILLSVTAASMLYALYRYGKIYFAMIKEYNESLKKTADIKINKFRQINIELFVKQLYNSYITMTANVQFGVLKRSMLCFVQDAENGLRLFSFQIIIPKMPRRQVIALPVQKSLESSRLRILSAKWVSRMRTLKMFRIR